MPESKGKVLWNLLMRGALSVIAGIIALFLPSELLYGFLLLFGAVLIGAGGLIIINAFRSKNDKQKTLELAEGAFSIIIGIIILNSPKTSLAVIMVMIGIWALAIGAFQLTEGIKMKTFISNSRFGIANGLLTIAFGILVLINVYAGAQALVMLYGVFALLSGISNFILLFKLKNSGEYNVQTGS